MFYEAELQSVPFFRFQELEKIPGLLHAFSSRLTDEASTCAEDDGAHDAKMRFLGLLGLREEQVIQLWQVHSNRVLQLDTSRSLCSAGDGILLTRRGRFAVIRTADCLAALAVDPLEGRLALVHAGWRGTLERVLSRALSGLIEAGSDPATLVLAFGPCIRRCCYEVGADLKDLFALQHHDIERIFEGRHLDLVEANRCQAESLGVTSILDSGLCTRCDRRLYSFRRDRERRRMWAVAGFLS